MVIAFPCTCSGGLVGRRRGGARSLHILPACAFFIADVAAMMRRPDGRRLEIERRLWVNSCRLEAAERELARAIWDNKFGRESMVGFIAARQCWNAAAQEYVAAVDEYAAVVGAVRLPRPAPQIPPGDRR
jgi:hypothetical protein